MHCDYDQKQMLYHFSTCILTCLMKLVFVMYFVLLLFALSCQLCSHHWSFYCFVACVWVMLSFLVISTTYWNIGCYLREDCYQEVLTVLYVLWGNVLTLLEKVLRSCASCAAIVTVFLCETSSLFSLICTGISCPVWYILLSCDQRDWAVLVCDVPLVWCLCKLSRMYFGC